VVTGSILDPGYSQSAYTDPLVLPNATIADLAKTWQDLHLANPGSEPPTTMLVSVGVNDGGTPAASIPGSVHALTDTLLQMFGRVVWVLNPAIDPRIIAEVKKSTYEYIYTTLEDAEVPLVEKILLGSVQASSSASLGGPISAVDLLHALNVVIPIKKAPIQGSKGPLYALGHAGSLVGVRVLKHRRGFRCGIFRADVAEEGLLGDVARAEVATENGSGAEQILEDLPHRLVGPVSGEVDDASEGVVPEVRVAPLRVLQGRHVLRLDDDEDLVPFPAEDGRDGDRVSRTDIDVHVSPVPAEEAREGVGVRRISAE
jgi:hypothetical protein